MAGLADVAGIIGELRQGNIDLNARPVVKNADGSISTVRSMSVGFDDGEYLIPTVAADGSRILSDEEAITQFKQTGKHLGVFDTPEHANAYAEALHNQQAAQYVPKQTSSGGTKMAGFDLASIISSATNLTGEQTQQAQEIANLSTQNQALSNEQAQKVQEAGNLQAQAQLVQLQGQLQTQKNAVTAANAFGTNVGDVSDIITQLGQTMRSTAIDLTKAQDRVTQIEANSDLLSNPLGWLTDLLQGDDARAERDALAAKFDSTQKIAQGLNAQTQATVQTQNAISETLTTASIQQAAESTRKLAEAKALEAKIQGNKFGADAIEALRTNGAQQFNRQMQVYSQITEDQRWQEGMALRREQFLATQEARARGKKDDQYYVEAAAQVNAYNKAAGLPEMNETQVRAQINQAGKIGEIIRDRQAQGFQIMESGNNAMMFGQTPAETVTRIERDNPKIPASFAPAKQILDDSIDVARAQITQATADPIKGEALKKDKAAQGKIYDAAVKGMATSLQANIQPGKGNPYEAVPLPTILQEATALRESKFGQVVLKTMNETGQTTPSPDLLMAMASSAISKKELSFNEARDGIAEYYAQSVGIKNATGGFIQLGVPPQIGYKTTVEVLKNTGARDLGSFLNPAQSPKEMKAIAKPLDLTNPTDVTLALTVMKSKELSQQILNKVPE